MGSGITKAIAKHNASAQALQMLDPSFESCGFGPDFGRATMSANVKSQGIPKRPTHSPPLSSTRGGVNTTLGHAQFSAVST